MCYVGGNHNGSDKRDLQSKLNSHQLPFARNCKFKVSFGRRRVQPWSFAIIDTVVRPNLVMTHFLPWFIGLFNSEGQRKPPSNKIEHAYGAQSVLSSEVQMKQLKKHWFCSCAKAGSKRFYVQHILVCRWNESFSRRTSVRQSTKIIFIRQEILSVKDNLNHATKLPVR